MPPAGPLATQPAYVPLTPEEEALLAEQQAAAQPVYTENSAPPQQYQPAPPPADTTLVPAGTPAPAQSYGAPDYSAVAPSGATVESHPTGETTTFTPSSTAGPSYAVEPPGGNDTYTFSESGVPFNPSEVHPQDRFAYTSTPYDPALSNQQWDREVIQIEPPGYGGYEAAQPYPATKQDGSWSNFLTQSVQGAAAAEREKPNRRIQPQYIVTDPGPPVTALPGGSPGPSTWGRGVNAPASDPTRGRSDVTAGEAAAPIVDWLMQPTYLSDITETNTENNRDALAGLLGLDVNDPETDYANQIARNVYDFGGDVLGGAANRTPDILGGLKDGFFYGARNLVQPLISGTGIGTEALGYLVEPLRDFPQRTATALTDIWHATEDTAGPHGQGVRQAQSTFDPVGGYAMENVDAINAALDALGGEKDQFTADPEGYIASLRAAQESQPPHDPTNKIEAGAQTLDEIRNSALGQGVVTVANDLQADAQKQAQIARGAALRSRLEGGGNLDAVQAAASALGAPSLSIPPAFRSILQETVDQATPQGRVVNPSTVRNPTSSVMEPTINRVGPRQDEEPGRWDRIKAGATDLANRAVDAVTPDEPYQGIPNYRVAPPFEPGIQDAGQRWADEPSVVEQAVGVAKNYLPDAPDAVPAPVKNLADQFIANSQDDEIFGLSKDDVRSAVGLDKGTPRISIGETVVDPIRAEAVSPGSPEDQALAGVFEGETPTTMPEGASVVNAGGFDWVVNAAGDDYLGIVDPATGEQFIFPTDWTDDQKQAKVDEIFAQATAATSTNPAPGPATASPATAATEAAPATTTSNTGSDTTYDTTNTSYDTGYTGKRRSRSYDDTTYSDDDDFPELSLEDFIKDHDGDGKISSRDRSIAKKLFAQAKASRRKKGKSTTRKQDTQQFPFGERRGALGQQIAQDVATALGKKG